MKKKFFTITVVLSLFLSCDYFGGKINKSKTKITTSEAVKIAEKKFKKYVPKILKAHDAILDYSSTYVGDFTGDGIDDIAIYYSLAPSGGGNMLSGQGIALYKNNGKKVKVIAGFEPNYFFSFDKIENGKIYIEKLDYREDDPRCCPSIKVEHALTISGNKVY